MDEGLSWMTVMHLLVENLKFNRQLWKKKIIINNSRINELNWIYRFVLWQLWP